MKIIECEKVVKVRYLVGTDLDVSSEFETDGNGNWWRWMGDSMECWYNEKDVDILEAEFKKWKERSCGV
jgi:hypothetical protein